jgi:uncharacterized membrane protein YfcA
MQNTLASPYFRKAFGWCVPIGALGGLIGLGGGEFRLPVLLHGIGFGAKSAVPLNLMVSLVTLAFAMATRSQTVPATAVLAHWPEVLGLAAGGMVSAFQGARMANALSAARLVHVIALLLAAIGCLMLLEVAFPFQKIDWLPGGAGLHFAVGAVIGIGIGLVSSILGVAGGELLIPVLIFVFGADIRTAGSASILISLVVVLSGLWRYWRMGAIPHGRGVRRITSAMGAGSILGAILGGLALGYAPVEFLKLFLGGVLIAAAAKTFLARRSA